MKRVHKFRAHSRLGEPGISARNGKQIPLRMTAESEIPSRSALFIVETSAARLEEIVEKMRKVCRLTEMEFFFEAYARYKNKIAELLDGANRILRKLSPSFQQSTYSVSEELRREHRAFLLAVSHLNLRRQTIYSGKISELLNKLTLDFDKFVHPYRSISVIHQFLAQFESPFQKSLSDVSTEIRSLIIPIEFEHMDAAQIVLVVQRLRAVDRAFSQTLISSMRERLGRSRKVPLNETTDWHATMIALVPIIANMPVFLTYCQDLSEEMPNLTDGIDQLCSEIDNLHSSSESLKKTSVRFAFDEARTRELILRASTFLKIDPSLVDPANALDVLVKSAHETVSQLEDELRIARQGKEAAERETAKQAMVKRFRQIRQATDEVTQRYQKEKDAFVEGILGKLKSLLLHEYYETEDEPPTRRFNIIYNHLLKDIADLRIRTGDNGGEFESPTDPVLKIVSSETTDFLITCCQRLSGNPDHALGFSAAESRLELLNLISQQNNDCQQYRSALENVCRRVHRPPDGASTPAELEKLALAGIDAQDGLSAIDVDKLMNGMTPPEIEAQVAQSRLEKVDRTLSELAPFDAILGRLTQLLNRRYSAFLPTSQYFGHFLDALSSLKEHMNRLDADAIFRPVHSLLVKSVELFNQLAISLASAGFAPEYSESHHAVAALLDAQQAAGESVAKLRVLLEEKEQLLLQETAKLESLEREFAEFVQKCSPEAQT
jgi:hypothetical protein